MVVNFKVREISWGTRKLTRTLILIIYIYIKFNLFYNRGKIITHILKQSIPQINSVFFKIIVGWDAK